jgi:hypothetical protein
LFGVFINHFFTSLVIYRFTNSLKKQAAANLNRSNF